MQSAIHCSEMKELVDTDALKHASKAVTMQNRLMSEEIVQGAIASQKMGQVKGHWPRLFIKADTGNLEFWWGKREI